MKFNIENNKNYNQEFLLKQNMFIKCLLDYAMKHANLVLEVVKMNVVYVIRINLEKEFQMRKLLLSVSV